MAKGDELVRYITERVVHYVETPKEVRKEQRTHVKEPWTTKWFGLIPASLSMLTQEMFKNKRHTR